MEDFEDKIAGVKMAAPVRAVNPYVNRSRLVPTSLRDVSEPTYEPQVLLPVMKGMAHQPFV